jgi:hypothetical protein
MLKDEIIKKKSNYKKGFKTKKKLKEWESKFKI